MGVAVEPRSKAAIALLAARGLALLAALHGLWVVATMRVGLRLVQGPRAVTLELLALGLSAVLVALAAYEDRGRARRSIRASFAWLFVVLVGTWGLFLAFAQPFQRVWFDVGAGLAAGAWAGADLLAGRAEVGGKERRAARLARGALVALAVTVAVAEVGVRVAARLSPSPLLARAGDGPRASIERFRCDPGQVHLGFRCNARGFVDDPLPPDPDPLVVAIGDSFLVGSVPHSHLFTTVCEERLGVTVDSVGVAGIGPPEYFALFVDEALPLAPDVCVIALFVGNDLAYDVSGEDLPDGLLRSVLARDRAALWTLFDRMGRVAAERRRTGGPAVPVPGGGARGAAPWLDDPALERPTLSEDAFLELETRRALEVCAGEPAALEDVARQLERAVRARGETELCVLLIPDEFQVEDGLWARIALRAGRPLDRDLPQRRLVAICEALGIAALDLLPVLRAVEPDGSGARRLYHARDTHFNARGNRVAGEALAEFLRPRLERR